VTDPEISITIAHWNRFDILAQCVESILNCDPKLSIEIIVVDNASSDDSVERIREAYPGVKLLCHTTNRGFGAAHNLAIRHARAPYVLVLNNDCELEHGCLASMLDFMEAHPAAGIATCQTVTHAGSEDVLAAGCLQYPTVGSIFIKSVLMYTGLATLVRMGRPGGGPDILGYALDPWKEHELAHVGGAFLFMRRTALDEVGTFDERFFLYLEETDLCKRMREHGWKVMYTPNARVVHKGSVSSELLPGRPAIHRKSTTWFLRKHHGRSAIWLYWIQELAIGISIKPLFLAIRWIYRVLGSSSRSP